MPRFHANLHEIVLKRFEELGVKSLLGSRAKLPEGGWEAVRNGGKVILENGEVVEGDLIASCCIFNLLEIDVLTLS